jgi:hypothetical protein
MLAMLYRDLILSTYIYIGLIGGNPQPYLEDVINVYRHRWGNPQREINLI